MVRDLHSGLLAAAVAQAKACWKGAGQQRCRWHLEQINCCHFLPGWDWDPPGPSFTLTTSLCYRKPWEQVPKKPKRKKSKWSPAWGGVGACRAWPGIGQLPSLSLCCTVRRETDGRRRSLPCLLEAVCHESKAALTHYDLSALPNPWVLGLHHAHQGGPERTSWWQ